MKRKVGALGLGLGVVVGVLLLFQNCTQPLQQVDQNQVFAEGLPFAFNTTIDTVAYMSCAGGSTQDPNAIWTFKAAALGAGSGVNILPEFYSATGNYNNNDRQSLLQASPENTGAQLQVALRDVTSIQGVMAPNGSSPVLGEHFVNLLAPLTDAVMAPTLLAANGQPVSYFSTLGAAGRMEARLRFTQDEGLAMGLRQVLATNARLMVTYKSTNTSRPDLVRGKAQSLSATSGYGRSYKFDLSYPAGDPSGARVIGAVQESDLLTGGFIGNWVCSSAWRLKIGRTGTDCPIINDGDPGNSGDPNRLAIVRRVLGLNEWYVNLSANCALQKTPVSQCYSTTEPGNHYVSICLKN